MLSEEERAKKRAEIAARVAAAKAAAQSQELVPAAQSQELVPAKPKLASLSNDVDVVPADPAQVDGFMQKLLESTDPDEIDECLAIMSDKARALVNPTLGKGPGFPDWERRMMLIVRYVQMGNVKEVKRLANKDSSLVHMGLDIPGVPAGTLGHLASNKGHLEVVKYLYKRWPENFRRGDQNHGNRASHGAAANGHVHILQFLLDNEPRTFLSKNKHGQVPKDVAKGPAKAFFKDLTKAKLTELIEAKYYQSEVQQVVDKLGGEKQVIGDMIQTVHNTLHAEDDVDGPPADAGMSVQQRFQEVSDGEHQQPQQQQESGACARSDPSGASARHPSGSEPLPTSDNSGAAHSALVPARAAAEAEFDAAAAAVRSASLKRGSFVVVACPRIHQDDKEGLVGEIIEIFPEGFDLSDSAELREVSLAWAERRRHTYTHLFTAADGVVHVRRPAALVSFSCVGQRGERGIYSMLHLAPAPSLAEAAREAQADSEGALLARPDAEVREIMGRLGLSTHGCRRKADMVQRILYFAAEAVD